MAERLKSLYDLQVEQVDGQPDTLVTESAIRAILEDSGLHSVVHRETVAEDGSSTLLLRGDASTDVHCVFEFSASSAGQWDVREGITITGSGTALTFRNQDRNSAETVVATARNTPVYTGSGTLLEAGEIAGGGKFTDGGGDAGTIHELVLKYSTDYLMRFIADTAARVVIGVTAWEHK